MNTQSVQPELLIETSWEVCNKIGGIYTVLSTKAKSLQSLYKDKLIFIGPDVWSAENPSPYFIESPATLRKWKATAQLPDGVTVRTGYWDIPGRPTVILVKFDVLYAAKDVLYGNMWDLYGVDSLHAYGDYDEACAFSHAAALVIESLAAHYGLDNGQGLIAHFNEWTTGMGLLHVKWQLPGAATVFTTHATSIGRSICGNGKPLYDYLPGYNGDQMARELNMESKHSLEKAAAHQADCFTTVSDVTATECTQLLEITPHVVTPNGFEPRFVPSKTRMPAARRAARLNILGIARALTGRRLPDDTTIIATSGRCEYRNKGIDLFLDSLDRLRAHCPEKPVLALILVPAWSRDARQDLATAMAANNTSHLADPIITHNLNNPDSDPIINRIHQLGFNTTADIDARDNVTVIYIPCYLNGNDGIVDMTYYDLLPAMDATVFPSYYEPWGYTPLESIAFGIPTVTTTLAGFGQWVLSATGNKLADTGVQVIERTDSNYDTVARAISDTLATIAHGTQAQKALAKAAQATAAQADWAHFIKHYSDAYDIALANAAKRK